MFETSSASFTEPDYTIGHLCVKYWMAPCNCGTPQYKSQ